MTPQQFITKWQKAELSERSAFQQHFLDLCELLGQPKPAEVDPKGTWYTFEKGVDKTDGGKGVRRRLAAGQQGKTMPFGGLAAIMGGCILYSDAVQDTISMDTANGPDFDGISLDTTTIPQHRLNIDNKERSNLFPWNGQFSPQLIEVLLATYAQAGNFVLDPFVGSGTVLHEAGRRDHPAFGSEVNPAAFKMAQVYRFINVKASQRRQTFEDAADALDAALPSTPSLFSSASKTPGAPIRQALADAATQAKAPLSKILLEALVVLLNYSEKELTADAVLATWGKLRETVQALPVSDKIIEPANCDARALPLPDHHAEIVITSPPYVNVFNYHQHYRRSVEALGWDLLEVARSEIGSNRKNRGNRYLTVIQYCIDMAAVLHELRRVCKPQARIIIVVGRESNVRKTRFFNGEIVARLAVRSVGYRLQARQERFFQNRFGEMIFEDILHLTQRPPQRGDDAFR